MVSERSSLSLTGQSLPRDGSIPYDVSRLSRVERLDRLMSSLRAALNCYPPGRERSSLQAATARLRSPLRTLATSQLRMRVDHAPLDDITTVSPTKIPEEPDLFLASLFGVLAAITQSVMGNPARAIRAS